MDLPVFITGTSTSGSSTPWIYEFSGFVSSSPAQASSATTTVDFSAVREEIFYTNILLIIVVALAVVDLVRRMIFSRANSRER